MPNSNKNNTIERTDLNDDNLQSLFDSLGLYAPTPIAPTPSTPPSLPLADKPVANLPPTPYGTVPLKNTKKPQPPRKKTPPKTPLPTPTEWLLPPPQLNQAGPHCLPPLLLIDALSLVELAHLYQQRQNVASPTPRATLEVASRLLAHVLTAAEPLHVSHWALLFESDPSTSWRLDIDPLYRRASPLQRQRTFQICSQWTAALDPALHLHCIQRDTLEARDLAHTLINQWKKNYPSHHILLASHRIEFLLLLDDYVQLSHPLALLHTPQTPPPATTLQLHKTLHISSSPQLWDMLILLGVPTLNIPGLPAVGIHKAATLLNEVKTLQHLNQTIYHQRNYPYVSPLIQKMRPIIASLLHYQQLLATKTDQPLRLTWKQLNSPYLLHHANLVSTKPPLQPFPIPPSLAIYKTPLDYS